MEAIRRTPTKSFVARSDFRIVPPKQRCLMRITQYPDIGDDLGECVVGQYMSISCQYEEIVQWLLVMGDDMNQSTPIYSGLSSSIVSYVRRFGAPPCESLWEWVKLGVAMDP